MVYERIDELCRQNHMSISSLERECGLGNATIRGWKNSSPKIDNLVKVADFFHVKVDDLLKPADK